MIQLSRGRKRGWSTYVRFISYDNSCRLKNPYQDSENELSIAIENELISYQLQFDKISDAILEMTENKPIYSQTRLNTNEDKQRLQYLESKMQTMESEVNFCYRVMLVTI